MRRSNCVSFPSFPLFPFSLHPIPILLLFSPFPSRFPTHTRCQQPPTLSTSSLHPQTRPIPRVLPLWFSHTHLVNLGLASKTNIFFHVYICMYVCMYVYTYLYTYTYIHTHLPRAFHTHTRPPSTLVNPTVQLHTPSTHTHVHTRTLHQTHPPTLSRPTPQRATPPLSPPPSNPPRFPRKARPALAFAPSRRQPGCAGRDSGRWRGVATTCGGAYMGVRVCVYVCKHADDR